MAFKIACFLIVFAVVTNGDEDGPCSNILSCIPGPYEVEPSSTQSDNFLGLDEVDTTSTDLDHILDLDKDDPTSTSLGQFSGLFEDGRSSKELDHILGLDEVDPSSTDRDHVLGQKDRRRNGPGSFGYNAESEYFGTQRRGESGRNADPYGIFGPLGREYGDTYSTDLGNSESNYLGKQGLLGSKSNADSDLLSGEYGRPSEQFNSFGLESSQLIPPPLPPPPLPFLPVTGYGTGGYASRPLSSKNPETFMRPGDFSGTGAEDYDGFSPYPMEKRQPSRFGRPGDNRGYHGFGAPVDNSWDQTYLLRPQGSPYGPGPDQRQFGEPGIQGSGGFAPDHIHQGNSEYYGSYDPVPRGPLFPRQDNYYGPSSYIPGQYERYNSGYPSYSWNAPGQWHVGEFGGLEGNSSPGLYQGRSDYNHINVVHHGPTFQGYGVQNIPYLHPEYTGFTLAQIKQTDNGVTYAGMNYYIPPKSLHTEASSQPQGLAPVSYISKIDVR